MAAFSDEELAGILRQCIRDIKDKDGTNDIPFTKPEILAAAQAIRDILDSAAFRTAVSDAINAAITPTTMTPVQKKRLFGRTIQALFSGEVT